MRLYWSKYGVCAVLLLGCFVLAGCGVRNNPETPTPGNKDWPGVYPQEESD